MATTWQQLLDSAMDSLKRIQDTDTEEWSQGQQRQRQIQINGYAANIKFYQQQIAAEAGQSMIFGITRIDS